LGHSVSLEVLQEKKYIPAHAENSTPDYPAHSVVNILTVLPWHSLMGSKKNDEQLSQDGQYPNKDLDMASPEHKPEASPLHHFTQFIQYISGNIQNATYQEEQTEHLPAKESISGCTSI